MTSTHRSSPEYRAAAQRFATGQYPCEIQGPTCTGPGTWVDHHPPLNGRTERQWLNDGGRYRPGCPTCQRRQGARITNHTRAGKPPPDDDTAPAWTW